MEPIVIEDDETSTQMNNSSLIYKILFWIFLFAFVCSLLYIFLFSNIKDTEKPTTQDLQTFITDNQQQYNKFLRRKRSEMSFADWKATLPGGGKYTPPQQQQQQVDPSKFGQMGPYANFG
jgi:hypothetical protein